MSQQKNTTRRSSRKNGKPRSKRGGSPLVMAITWGTSLVAAVVIGFVIINSSAFQSLRTWLAGGEIVAAVDEPNSAADRTEFNQEPHKSGELPSYPLETDDGPATDDNDSELAAEDKNGVVLTGHQGPLALPAKPTNQEDPSQTQLIQAPGIATQTNNPLTDGVAQETDQDNEEVNGGLVIKPGKMSLKPFQEVAPSERKNQADDSPDQPKTAKLAVPAKEAQRASLKEIKTLLADQYADRTDEGQNALAETLLKLGEESEEDAIVRYVCLTESIETASQIGDIETALTAVNQIYQKFDVESNDLRLDTINSLTRKVKNEADATGLINLCRPIVQDLIDADDYRFAIDVARKTLSVAKKLNNQALATKLDRQLDKLKRVEREYRAVIPIIEKLKTDPHDAEANQAVGEFYCLVKGDFDKGLLYLVKGADADTTKTARLELKGATSTEEQLAIANGWWDLASPLDDLKSGNAREHAAVIYRRELENVTGITRATIESRLKELAEQSGNDFNDAFFRVVWQVKWQNGHPEWERAQFFADGRFENFALNKTWKNTWLDYGDTLQIKNPKGTYNFSVRLDGDLLTCVKFNNKTGRILDQGIGTFIKREKRRP